MKYVLAFALTLFSVTAAALPLAGDGPDDVPAVPSTPASLRAALLDAGDGFGRAAAMPAAGGGTRSIPLAFGMSAVVPGLGQAYNRQWIKTAAAVVLEAAFAYGAIHYRRQGRDEEDVYQAYAHAHWSPVQYAEWLNDYALFLEVAAPQINTEGVSVDFARPETWTTEDRQAARRLFDQIHAVEDDVYHPETGASFSHKLPYFGEQQYYELIGKYFQFAPGWEDYPVWRDGDEFTGAIDPERTGPDGGKPNVSDRFWAYDDLTEHANDLLRRASRASAFLLLNHLVSAVDAAVFAKLHNDRLETDVAVGYDALGRPQPVATLRVRL